MNALYLPKDLSNVEYLPEWKIGATASERFQELAVYAAKKPERFTKMLACYVEVQADGVTQLRYSSLNMSTTEMLGILTETQLALYADTRKG